VRFVIIRDKILALQMRFVIIIGIIRNCLQVGFVIIRAVNVTGMAPSIGHFVVW
jgi:hypothetical protein